MSSSSPDNTLTRPTANLVSPQPFEPSRRLRFREIGTHAELREHFRLRYQVYRASGFLPGRADRMDVDPFDLHSRFLGVFLASGRKERMIGGVRMVCQDDSSPLGTRIRRLGVKVEPRPTLFPSEKAFDLFDVLDECRRQGRQVVEFSRTVLLPEFRGLGAGQGLVQGIYALAMSQGIDLGIGSTPPHLRDFYLRLGCRLIPRRETSWYADLSTDALALLIDLQTLPEDLAAAVRESARQLASEGCFAL